MNANTGRWNFTLKLDTGNAAFGEEFGAELARILKRVAKDVADFTQDGGHYADTIQDANGNTVGEWKYKP